MRRALPAALLLGAILGCGDDGPGFQVVPADGFFDPTAIDFGEVQVGDAAQLEVRLSNNGGAPLALRTLDFEPRLDAFAVRGEDGSVRGRTLEPQQSVTLVVVFGPSEPRVFESTLVLVTDEVQVSLPVTGEGKVLAPARLEGPQTLTVPGEIEVGGRATLAFGVRNVGERPARLVASAPSGPFALLGPQGGALSATEIPPGGRVGLELAFSPSAPGFASGTLQLSTEDGARLDIAVSGEAVAPGHLTCAQTAVSFGEVARGEDSQINLHCESSGGPVTVSSVAFDPAGPFSVTTASPGPGVQTTALDLGLRFDAEGLASGERQADLRIALAHGTVLTVPAAATVRAPAPAEIDVSVALAWSTDVDLDLHLVRGNALPYTPGEDCHWNASTLDWGVMEVFDDDPFLDRDARRGPGEEVVNLTSAAETRYQVWVQYFDPNGGATDVPVEFEVTWSIAGGQSQGAQTFSLAACGQIRRVGEIDMAAGTFSPLDEVSDAFAGYTFTCAP